MSGPVILRRLVVLSRSRTTPTDPARDFGGKDRQIRRYGCTNGRALDLIRSILGGQIEGMGYRRGANSFRSHHSPSETRRKYSDIPIRCY